MDPKIKRAPVETSRFHGSSFDLRCEWMMDNQRWDDRFLDAAQGIKSRDYDRCQVPGESGITF